MVKLIHIKDQNMVKKIYTELVTNCPTISKNDIIDEDLFSKKIQSVGEKYPVFVYEEDEILAMAYATAFSDRKAYEHCANVHIYTIFSEKDEKIKKELLGNIEEKLRDMGIINLYVTELDEKTEENTAHKSNINFLKENGFEQVSLLENWAYEDGKWYDCLCFAKSIGQHNSDMKNVTFENSKAYTAFVIKECNEYVVEIVDFGVSTRGATKEEAVKKAKELMECVAESFVEEGLPLPEAIDYSDAIISGDKEVCFISLSGI